MNLENLPLIIYLIDVFGATEAKALLAIILFIYCFIIAAFIRAEVKEENQADVHKTFKTRLAGITCIILICYVSVVPSKETAYKMLAVYAGTAALDTEIAAKLSDTSLKALDTLNRVLDEYAKEEEAKNETN